MSDPLYWLTTLALNFEGTDAAATAGDFVDISPSPKTVSTVTGAAQLDTGVTPISGTGSLLLSGGSASIHYAANAGFDFGTGGVGTGDFCLELWWRPTAVGATQQLLTYTNPTVPSGSDYAFGIYQHTSGKIYAFVQNGTSNFGALNTTTNLTANTWNHIAYVRSNGVCSLYLNGVAEGGTANALVAINTPASRILQIGTQAAANYATGSIDGVRITKGSARYTSNFSLALPTGLFEASDPGTADGEMSAPMGTLESTGGGYADLTGPIGTLSATTGAQCDLTAPMGTLWSISRDTSGENAFSGTAPMGTLQALTGASASLTAPMGTLVASMTVPVSVHADLTGPMGELLSSGTVAVQVHADLMLTSAGTLVAVTGAGAALQAPMGTLEAAATVGALMRMEGTLPMGELNAIMTAGIVVHATLSAPMIQPVPVVYASLAAPMGLLEAYARAVVTVTYEAYAVNLKPGPKMPNQVTRYTNYPFNQIVRYQGRYIGVADDGLYELGGDTDYDADTPTGPPWAWHTGETDFNSPQKKNVRESMFAGRLGPSATASVSVREAANRTYAAEIVRGTDAQNHRIKYGRGLSARYWSFGWADPDGGTCEPDAIEFEAAELGRKL